MLKKRRRGLYEKKRKYFTFFLALGCVLCTVCCGALCVSVGEAQAPEDPYNGMEASAIPEETEENTATLFFLDAKATAASDPETEPATTEPEMTEKVKATEPAESTAPSGPAAESEVVIVLAANNNSRYPGLILTQDDKDLLIKILWLEGRGEPFEGQQGIAEVVFNRVVNEKYFPDTVHGVIFDNEIAIQFPTAYMLDRAYPTEKQYEVLSTAIEQALNGPYVLPVDVVFFGVEPENDNIWGKIGGHHFCYPWYP